MKNSICIFLFFISFFTFSQVNKAIADSIYNLAAKEANDSLEIEYLHKTFFKYCYAKPKIARALSQRSIDLSNALDNEYLLTRSYLRHGIYYDIIGKQDSALVSYQKAFDVAESVDDLQAMASVYNNRGLIHWDREDHEKALDNYLKSLKIFKDLKQPRGQANNLNNIGLILLDLDRIDESTDYHKQSLELRKKIKDSYGIGASYSNLSKNYGLSKRLDSSLFFSHKAIKIKTAINDIRGLAIAYNNLGGDYNKLKVNDSAIFYLKKADSVYQILKSKRLRATNANSLGYVYNRNKKPREAIAIFNIAKQNLDSTEFNALYRSTYGMANSYYTLGNYMESSDLYRQAIVYKDSIIAQNETLKTQEIYEKYQSAEKQKQILIQRAELAEKEVIIQKRNYQIYGALGLALILGLIGYLFYSQQKIKNRQLQKEAVLKDALIKIETQNRLQEQRLRISRDLHDNIGAQLTFIISSIDNLKYGFELPSKLETKLSTISDFTSDTISELRDTIWAMNKDEISFEDLEVRITNFIEKAKLYDANISFQFKIDESLDKSLTMSSFKGMNIHRVIQEAVHNSLKHSKASEIFVNISKEINNLKIEISDNGIGFDEDTIELGSGLNNIHKRIADIGGEVRVESIEGSGTQIIILV